ncbi:MAG: ATP-binding cassette domain-containing protein, partial [Actinobacteria bacterium]|nr:ATP-binding cassette domain-containing protein [Actinomycetota bacterium]
MTSLISVNDLSYCYPIYAHPRDLLLEVLLRRERHDSYWALRNIQFDVQESERLGVIGHNGSGKSTLLKILTGTLSPSSGQVSVSGRISAMLGFNASLNPEETGLRNIRLNLLLNGHPKSQIDSITEEIIEFTELGSFIYAPVKTYSAGMNAKLAFAISTAVEPGILVIDEVLSVGDSYFMGKATKRMLDLCDRGQALIFVSHSMTALQMLCNRVLWLDKGQVRMLGDVNDVIAEYEKDYRRHEDEVTRAGNTHRANSLRDRPTMGSLDTRYHRLRIVPSHRTTRFTDTHYVSNITVCFEKPIPVPLEILDVKVESSPQPHIDVLGSEWGRLVTRDGQTTRTLSTQSGRLAGGHILLPTDLVFDDQSVGSIQVDCQSINEQEEIVVEIFDLESGTWRPLPVISRTKKKHGWWGIVAELTLTANTEPIGERADDVLKSMYCPDVEIKNVQIIVDGTPTNRFKPSEAFSIRIVVEPNIAIGDVDVGFKLFRAD